VGIKIEGRETRNNEWPEAVVTMTAWDHESLGISLEQPLPIRLAFERSVQMHRVGENQWRATRKETELIEPKTDVDLLLNAIFVWWQQFSAKFHIAMNRKPKSLERVSEAIRPARR